MLIVLLLGRKSHSLMIPTVGVVQSLLLRLIYFVVCLALKSS